MNFFTDFLVIFVGSLFVSCGCFSLNAYFNKKPKEREFLLLDIGIMAIIVGSYIIGNAF